MFTDDGKLYLERFGGGTQGWQSFDYNAVHFIGLINVLNLKQGSGTGLGGSGFGQLGQEQLAWLQKDVKALSSSTPIVVFCSYSVFHLCRGRLAGTVPNSLDLVLLVLFITAYRKTHARDSSRS